jgi:hypothetical protein
VTDSIRLTVPSGLRGTTVVALVLGGLGSRLDLPVDRIDELTLATTTVAEAAIGPELNLECDVSSDRLLVRMGPLGDGAAGDPATRRVVDALVDRVAPLHDGEREWIELELGRGATG